MNKTHSLYLGEYLSARRHELGLSTHEVARRSGVNQAQVSRIEQGVARNPNPDTLVGIAKALELETADVWTAAGYSNAIDLPSPMPYLRAKYRDLPEAQLRALSRDVSDALRRQGIDPSGRPKPGEDETPEPSTHSSPKKGGQP